MVIYPCQMGSKLSSSMTLLLSLPVPQVTVNAGRFNAAIPDLADLVERVSTRKATELRPSFG